MNSDIIQTDKSYYNDNIKRYSEVCEKLNERVLTYNDNCQSIAYMPDDKRAILCYNVLNSLSFNDLSLNYQYKDLIEYIVNNPNIGISQLPSFLYNGKTYTVGHHKIVADDFKLAFFPFGKSKKYDFVETFDSYKSFTYIVYSFFIKDNSVYIRYAQVKRENKKLSL